MAAPGVPRSGISSHSRAAVSDHAVLVCQACPNVWEPAGIDPDEFALLVRNGCPECGGWVWIGEAVAADGLG